MFEAQHWHAQESTGGWRGGSALPPGRRTLTMSLPAGRGRGLEAVKGSPWNDGGQGGELDLRLLLDAVIRPDLYEPPAGPRTSGGIQLPAGVRAKMERCFNADFSAVRVHEDGEAARLGAAAYARGADLHFAPGQYEPGSRQGLSLIGHELAHVVQQAQGRVSTSIQYRGAAVNLDVDLEREADELGERAAKGEVVALGSRVVAGEGRVIQGAFRAEGQELTEGQIERLEEKICEIAGKGVAAEFVEFARKSTVFKELSPWLDRYSVAIDLRDFIGSSSASASTAEASSPLPRKRIAKRRARPRSSQAPKTSSEAPPAPAARASVGIEDAEGIEDADDESEQGDKAQRQEPLPIPRHGFLAECRIPEVSPTSKRSVPKTRKVPDGQRDSKATKFLKLWEAHIQSLFAEFVGRGRTSNSKKRQGEWERSLPVERHLARLAWVLNQLASAKRVCTAVVASPTKLFVYTNGGDRAELEKDCRFLLNAAEKDIPCYLLLLERVASQTINDSRGAKSKKKRNPESVEKAKRRLLKAILLLQELSIGSFEIVAHQSNTAHKHCELRHGDAVVPRDTENRPVPSTVPVRHSIGVAKLFCLKCGLAIKVLRSVYHIELVGLGHHMTSYNTEAGWTMPDFIRDNDEALTAFLGIEAYEIFCKDRPYYIRVIENYRLNINKYPTTDIVSSGEELDEEALLDITTTASESGIFKPRVCEEKEMEDGTQGRVVEEESGCEPITGQEDESCTQCSGGESEG